MTDHFLTARAAPTNLQGFAIRALALFGWRVKHVPPPGPRGVVVVYPHTSNWDFVVGLFAKWAVGIRFRWLGKPALFRGVCGAILGPFFRACGGEPVERDTSTGAIERLAARIKSADHYWLAITPEGTRKYRDHWRSGFYHIALTADVPLGIACIDYRSKQVRLVDYLTLSGDVEADLAHIRAACEGCHGLNDECAAPIGFAKASQRAATDSDTRRT